MQLLARWLDVNVIVKFNVNVIVHIIINASVSTKVTC